MYVCMYLQTTEGPQMREKHSDGPLREGKKTSKTDVLMPISLMNGSFWKGCLLRETNVLRKSVSWTLERLFFSRAPGVLMLRQVEGSEWCRRFMGAQPSCGMRSPSTCLVGGPWWRQLKISIPWQEADVVFVGCNFKFEALLSGMVSIWVEDGKCFKEGVARIHTGKTSFWWLGDCGFPGPFSG